MATEIDAREKLLRGAERLFRRQGYAASGLTEILRVSAAPKGSFYFYFPQGKRQLAREVLARYAARVEAGLKALAARYPGEPEKFVGALLRAAAKEMEATNWTQGCLVQNFANELAASDRQIADDLAAVFVNWRGAIADALVTNTKARDAVERDAMALLASLEGARTLARAMRSSVPFIALMKAERP
jgi:TetR/AcrR family transcriptional repressor of lmrAB and yxaGH operons